MRGSHFMLIFATMLEFLQEASKQVFIVEKERFLRVVPCIYTACSEV